MRGIFIFLLLFVQTSLAWNPFSDILDTYHELKGSLAVCPQEMLYEDRPFVSCEDVCNDIKEKFGYEYSEVVHQPPDGVDPGIPLPRLCACRLADKNPSEDIPYKDVICAYAYELDAFHPGISSFNIADPKVFSDMPTKLVHLFTFRSKDPVPVSPEGAVILGGFYGAYLEVIRSWTSLFALALVAMIAGWNILLPGASALIQKIRHKETDIAAIAAENLVRVSMAVIPSVGFFALPVPVGSEGIVFLEDVRPQDAKFMYVRVAINENKSGDLQMENIKRGDLNISIGADTNIPRNGIDAFLASNGSMCKFYEYEARRLEAMARAYESLAQQYKQKAAKPEELERFYKERIKGKRGDEKALEQHLDAQIRVEIGGVKQFLEREIDQELDKMFGYVRSKVPQVRIGGDSQIEKNFEKHLNYLIQQCTDHILRMIEQRIWEELNKYLLSRIPNKAQLEVIAHLMSLGDILAQYCGITNYRALLWELYDQTLKQIEQKTGIYVKLEFALNIRAEYLKKYQELDNWIWYVMYDEAAKEFRKMASATEEMAKECEKIVDQIPGNSAGGGGTGGGGWFWDNGKINFSFVIYRGGDDTAYLPLAVGVVGSFVDFGLDGAKAMAKAINSIVILYQSMKLNKELNALKRMEAENKAYWERLKVHEAQLGNFWGSAYECGIANCEQVLRRELAADTQPKCVHIVHFAKAYCNMLKVYKERKGKEQKEEERKEKEQGEEKNYSEEMQKTMLKITAGISDSFTWMAPAILTQAPLFTIFSSLSGDTTPDTKLELVYKSTTTPDTGVRVTGGGDFIKEAADEGASTLNDIVSNIGFSKENFYLYGMALAVTSLPPASFIKNAINDSIGGIMKSASGLLKKVGEMLTKSVAGAKLGFIATGLGMGINLAGSTVSLFAGTILAFMVGTVILKSLPMLVVSGVVVFRFIAYLFDLAKFMITLPFFAVAASTKRPETTMQFFAHTLKLTTTPMLISFMPLVAFVAVEITQFFFFNVPMYFILQALNVYGGVWAWFAYFLAGMANGYLFVFSTFLALMVAWDTASGFIDGVYSYVNQLVGSYYSSGERLASMTRSVFLGRLM